MADEGFDKTVTVQNGPELQKFAYYVLLYYFENSRAIAEDERLQRMLALWLRDNYPEYTVDPNSPLTEARFMLNERLHIPAKNEICDIIEVGISRATSREDEVIIPFHLNNAQWLDTEGNELPYKFESPNYFRTDYYIEEEALCLSVEYREQSNTQVTFSVYR
jgi:hypothetical protein